MTSARSLLLLLAAAVLACGGETPSQTMLVVSLGDGLDAETYAVTVTITSAHPDSPQTTTETVAQNAFPLCIAVVPSDDDASRTFGARVELRREGDVVASREIETGFVAGEVRAVAIEMNECAGEGCGPSVRVEPSTPYASALCSGDERPDAGSLDSGTADAGTADAGTADAGCIDRPGLNCRVSEVSDVDADGFLRRGFFADGSLVLYGSNDDAIHLVEVGPAQRTIGQYSIAETEDVPVPLLVAGGGYVDGQACIALANEAGSHSLLVSGSQLQPSTNNHLVVCDGADRVVERMGPTTGFAMGLRGDQPVYAFESAVGDWFVTVGTDRLVGESEGAVSDVRARGGDSRTCMSATFDGSWTTYNTNSTLRPVYSAAGENATLVCSTGGNNPAQSYHFGGPGDEEVLSLFIDAPNVIALVRHSDSLYLQVENGAPSSVSPSPGWTLLTLTPSSLAWSRTFEEESSAERLDDELVIARTTGEENTTLEWYSMENGELSEDHTLDGVWSIVATEDVDGTPQRLGLVAPTDEAKARIILVSRE